MSRNQGMNKLTKDEYTEAMDSLASKSNKNISIERSDATAYNQHTKMLIVGKTIQLHKLLAFWRRSRSNNQLADAMSMTYAFDPEAKLVKFQEEISKMYSTVIEEFIYRECPENIFDTGFYDNKRADFIEMVICTSKRGRDLRKLISYYYDEIES
jgi:hypothetical protein